VRARAIARDARSVIGKAALSELRAAFEKAHEMNARVVTKPSTTP
jgi:hypothetical protein